MEIRRLDTVVLARDLPAYGLRAGDLGAVVETYPPDGLEVEFLTASGRTGALVTLHPSDVRRVADDDLVTVPGGASVASPRPGTSPLAPRARCHAGVSQGLDPRAGALRPGNRCPAGSAGSPPGLTRSANAHESPDERS